MEELRKIIKDSIWKYHHYKEIDVSEHYNYYTKKPIITVRIDCCPDFVMQEDNDEEGIKKLKKFVGENPYRKY